ncbi:MAG: 30S ribosomal protein S20 [Candidatus Paceibacterota bacterium]|jgi:small subunit ribosomal protein S20|nr:30S ribosomal protein S20 [Candidatus Paceibacterota bacterium]MDD3548648.1 30S ribosomal protein S20 [Candidatus Paceibacterota bacterium]MDD4999148.1 30S ribosomal protein S20 [Candidatus Paceibacterota bacterium]MDD5545274.1 30S ribosomal protein S20 [Candidatus Paceibacterota bacterium]
MPITRSAKRALKKNLKTRKINAQKRRLIKEEKKDYWKLVESGKKEEAQKKLSYLYKIIDKAAKVNLIKKNKASREKAILAKKLKKIQTK